MEEHQLNSQTQPLYEQSCFEYTTDALRKPHVSDEYQSTLGPQGIAQTWLFQIVVPYLFAITNLDWTLAAIFTQVRWGTLSLVA